MCHPRSGITSYIDLPDPPLLSHVQVYSLSLLIRHTEFAERIKPVLVIRQVRVLEGIPLGVEEPREVINKKECDAWKGKGSKKILYHYSK